MNQKKISTEQYEKAKQIIIDYETQEARIRQAPNGFVDLPLEDLNLSTRAIRSLKWAHIHRTVDLMDYQVEDLMQMRNMGPVTIREIVEKFKAIGINIE